MKNWEKYQETTDVQDQEKDLKEEIIIIKEGGHQIRSIKDIKR